MEEWRRNKIERSIEKKKSDWVGTKWYVTNNSIGRNMGEKNL